MTTIDKNKQNLVTELLELSAKIDILVIKSKQVSTDSASNNNDELEELRAKQHEITKKLQLLEENINGVWENIGDGG